MSAERNCTGTVVALQYCHVDTRNENVQRRLIFNLFLLSDSDEGFTINRSIGIKSVTSDDVCTNGSMERICCNKFPLNNNLRFQLPSSDYTVGIRARDKVELLTFLNNSEFIVHQFQGKDINQLTLLDNQPLPLLRFHVNNGAGTVASYIHVVNFLFASCLICSPS